MIKRVIVILIGLAVLLGVGIFLFLPPILRALPSRYVAIMPEPLQALGVRDHVEQLPTVQATVELAAFIAPEPTSTQPAEPPSPTAIPTTGAIVPAATATPVPTPLPPTPTPLPIEQAVRLSGIQHQYQAWNNCGPATIAMGLSFFDINLLQHESATWLKPNPEDRNVSPGELVNFVKDTTDLEAIDRANGSIDQVRQLLTQGIPVIIETGIDPPGEYAWMGWYGHYLLVVAYDDEKETFWVYDSWLGDGVGVDQDRVATGTGRPISYRQFDRYWRQFNRQYIAIYEAEQQNKIEAIVGDDLDDHTMWSDALATNKRELEGDPDDAFLWFNLGTTYNALGDYEMASQAYDNARSLGLPWRMLWYQFGPYETYYEVGRYEDVIELADVTLHQRPYFEESFYYRGLAKEALGNDREARQDFKKAAEFNPRFQQAQQALARLEG